MTVRKFLLLLALLAALAVPVLMAGSAQAESGCHRSGSGSPPAPGSQG